MSRGINPSIAGALKYRDGTGLEKQRRNWTKKITIHLAGKCGIEDMESERYAGN